MQESCAAKTCQVTGGPRDLQTELFRLSDVEPQTAFFRLAATGGPGFFFPQGIWRVAVPKMVGQKNDVS